MIIKNFTLADVIVIKNDIYNILKSNEKYASSYNCSFNPNRNLIENYDLLSTGKFVIISDINE